MMQGKAIFIMSFRKMRRISFTFAPFTFLIAISLRRRFTSSLV
ncbi:Uncharacterised protein [Segatella copri]|nr:Uncharacterised protein [Segatella copri]